MSKTRLRPLGLLALLLPCVAVACGGLNLGDIAAFLGPSVTVIIENDTSFTAIPDLSAGEGRNVVEDLFSDEERIDHFGINGAIQPDQVVTVRLPCDDELELIYLHDVEFREGNGFPLGEADIDTKLRRDRDFDCGDTVYIRLSGTLFNFYADVDVERVSRGSGGDADEDELDDDIADFLEELFD